MTVLMITVILFGIGLGYIQGVMDPESSRSTWKMFDGFQKEMALSSKFGLVLGALSSLIIHIIRTLELPHRQPLIFVDEFDEEPNIS